MIIDRHMVRQVAMPCLLVSAVLMIIFVGYSLSRFLTQADAGLLNSAEVIHLTLLKVLIALEVLLPIGLFFGLILGLGKLHSDSEIIAMQASGMGEARMLRPVVALAIPLALFIAVLSFYVRPWAYAQTYTMLALAEASSDIDRIKAGQFYLTRKTAADELSEDQDSERAIFIEKISPDQALERIFIRTRVGDELQLISSQTGLFIEQPESQYHLLELDDARIFKRVDDGPDLFAQIGSFTMRVVNELPEPLRYRSKFVASSVLAESSNPKDRAEYQWRLSTPVTTLLLALLTVPLSRSRPRQGRYAKLLLAFAVYAAYYNLLEVSQTWVKQERASSIWWTPLLLMLLVVLVYIPWRSLGKGGAAAKNEEN
ncbi:MAG: LPS export ABC transporter permease LptF [Marinobacter sp.]|uniref:LPS export ABC transporter permease LptF n=1 Tax=Marinobacter sp. TaxID=50741 RepID=UPI00329A2178